MSDRIAPGSWSILADEDPDGGFEVVGPHQEPVALIPSLASPRDALAVARLVAAAPDLLALAQQVATECGDCHGTGAEIPSGKPCEACADIRAVIAKTGVTS